MIKTKRMNIYLDKNKDKNNTYNMITFSMPDNHEKKINKKIKIFKISHFYVINSNLSKKISCNKVLTYNKIIKNIKKKKHIEDKNIKNINIKILFSKILI